MFVWTAFSKMSDSDVFSVSVGPNVSGCICFFIFLFRCPSVVVCQFSKTITVSFLFMGKGYPFFKIYFLYYIYVYNRCSCNYSRDSRLICSCPSESVFLCLSFSKFLYLDVCRCRSLVFFPLTIPFFTERWSHPLYSQNIIHDEVLSATITTNTSTKDCCCTTIINAAHTTFYFNLLFVIFITFIVNIYWLPVYQRKAARPVHEFHKQHHHFFAILNHLY